VLEQDDLDRVHGALHGRIPRRRGARGDQGDHGEQGAAHATADAHVPPTSEV
jgi:hypothetical protein